MDTWNCGGSWPTISSETTAIETEDTYGLPKEHDIGFDQPAAMLAPWYRRIHDSFLDLFVIIRALALNTSLRGETPVSFDNFLLWDPRSPLKRVDVLGEASVEKTMRMQHFDE